MRSFDVRSLPRLLVSIGAFSATLAAIAADGRVPIHELPAVITDPGSYYVTRNLSYSGSQSAIEIQADDVTIDFNGHTVDYGYQGTYGIYALDRTNIRLHNGHFKGGNVGIYLKNTVGDDFVVRIHDMQVSGALNEGIYVYGQSLVGSSKVFVERNLIHHNGNDGLHLRFMWGGRVVENVISDNTNGSSGSHGIYLHSCRNVSIVDNNVSDFSGDGIRVWYSWYIGVEDNLSSYNAGWGLDVYQGTDIVYRNNRAYGNGSGGFDIPGGEGHVNAGGNYPTP